MGIVIDFCPEDLSSRIHTVVENQICLALLALKNNEQLITYEQLTKTYEQLISSFWKLYHMSSKDPTSAMLKCKTR